MSHNPRRFSIGSSNGCDVVLADDTVAPLHAYLDVVDSGPLILSAEALDRRTEVVHQGRARAIRKGIVTSPDVLRFGDVEIPVDEVLVAIKLGDHRGLIRGDFPEETGVAKTPFAKTPFATPLPRLAPGPTPGPAKPADGAAAKKAPADSRPLTRSLVLPCPVCGKPTKSMKRHRLYRLLVFIGVAWWAQTAEYTACPPCMRHVILVRTLVNIPTANLTWPILFVIHAFQFASTFTAGHSRKVLELLKA